MSPGKKRVAGKAITSEESTVDADEDDRDKSPIRTITWGISPGWRFFFLAIRDFDGECSKVAAYIAKDPNMETV